MAEQLQKTFQGATAEDAIPNFDTQQYYSTMQQVMQNPQFMSMAEHLGTALMQVYLFFFFGLFHIPIHCLIVSPDERLIFSLSILRIHQCLKCLRVSQTHRKRIRLRSE
jgi:hypothetical protein